MKTASNRALEAMKKSILVLTALVTVAFFSCTERAYIDSPGDNSHNVDTLPVIVDPDPTPDPEGLEIPADAITVNEAVSIAKKLASGAVTDKVYFVKGWVTGFNEEQRAKTDFARYGNDFAYMSARNDGQGNKQFYCYRIMGPNGAKLPDYETIVIGDFIVVRCKLTNYNGTYENSGDCWTVASTNEHFNEVFAEQLIPADTIYATCAEAKAAALALANNNEPTKDIYVIEGYVQKDGYKAEVSRGQQVFWIDDKPAGSKVFESYYCNVPNEQAVPVGAKVRLIGPIMKYNTTAEMKNGDVEILEAPAE